MMFSFTYEILNYFLSSNKKKNTNKKCYLRVIARIALMIRKFQKIESEKYIDSIDYKGYGRK